MEKYSDFLERISYQQAELQICDGDFVADDRVYKKVNEDNSFRAFYGDTTVFTLNGKTRKKISEMIDVLYEHTPECFSQRLDEHTLHMTLHDLSSSDNLSEISEEMFENEIRLLRCLEKDPVKEQSIEMKTNYIVNMVDTSLIMALIPADKTEWHKLQKLYSLVDKVRVCPYPYLTPHITLAYFSHNGFTVQSAEKLREVVKELNSAEKFTVSLHTDKLFYQKFVDMEQYINIFRFTACHK